ncbi:MAG: hypothetical protein ABI175_25455 [Polyangiales bacterium]
MCHLRLRRRLLALLPMLLVAACGGNVADAPGEALDDGGSDTSAAPDDTKAVPPSEGGDGRDAPIACTAPGPQHEGAACSVAGMVCSGESSCQMCGYMSWSTAPTQCTCTAAGKWSCATKYHTDCGPFAPGTYSDATCTTRRDTGAEDASVDDAPLGETGRD